MIRDIFLMSLSAMRAHKVRTLLTLLGVILGITSIVAISTAGNSFGYYIEKQTKILNQESMTIGVGTDSKIPTLNYMEKTFTDKDIEHIRNLPHIREATPLGGVFTSRIGIRNGFLKWEWKRSSITFLSAYPSYLDMEGWEIEEGKVFQEGKNEIIISKRMIDYFGQGSKIKVGGIIYIQRVDRLTPIKAKIVGILKEPEKMITFTFFPDVIGPIDPYYLTQRGSRDFTDPLRPVTLYTIISAIATDVNSVDEAKNECLEYLSYKSDAKDYKEESLDFIVITQQDFIDQTKQMVSTVNMFIVAIASISLIIGAIGIANIMFANVRERTREIGTMRAIGAKKRDILQLFLYQSVTIGLIGGILGCILGANSGTLVVSFINNNIENLYGKELISIPVVYSYEWFFIAFTVGIILGTVAGLLPAIKAAIMDPVKALRYE